MHRSIITRSMVEDLLANERQYKEQHHDFIPKLLSGNSAGKGYLRPLWDLAADADARRAQFLTLGKLLPEFTEVLFICETWVVAADEMVDASQVMPSHHPNRQEAIIITGRNCTNTKSVFAMQPFSKKGTDISWQLPQISTKPGCAQGLVDLLFAP